MHINSMPQEVLRDILLLCAPDAWSECAQVNKLWNTLVSQLFSDYPSLKESIDLLIERIQLAPEDRYLKITLLFPWQPKFNVAIETGIENTPKQELTYSYLNSHYSKLKEDTGKLELINNGYKQVLSISLDTALWQRLISPLKTVLKERQLLIQKFKANFR